MLPRLLPALRHREAPAILDVGCGTGPLLRLIGAALPRASLFGIDSRPPRLNASKASWPSRWTTPSP